MKPGAPPLLVIHGTADKLVSISMAERLVQRAKEVGVICEFHPLEGKGHAAIGPLFQELWKIDFKILADFSCQDIVDLVMAWHRRELFFGFIEKDAMIRAFS